MTAPKELPAFLRQSKQELHAKFVDLEWQQRNRLLVTTNSTSTANRFARLSGDAIAARNRYLNVEPYAANRIKLQVGEGHSDYINASPIRLGTRRYIATQGPKDTSVNHFYRMVASEVASPVVVVMLTQTHEAGREKCFQYFPLDRTESPLAIPPDRETPDGFAGEVKLVSIKDDENTRSQHRVLHLHTTTGAGQSQVKEVHHLLFSAWPDFLVPEGEDRNALLRLVQLSAQLNSRASTTAKQVNGDHDGQDRSLATQNNPRIVHCSAGVGRSGTFIALDYLISLLRAGKLDALSADSDPIADVVDLLRQQRMMMVQGESQFLFLYDVMREQFRLRMGLV